MLRPGSANLGRSRGSKRLALDVPYILADQNRGDFVSPLVDMARR